MEHSWKYWPNFEKSYQSDVNLLLSELVPSFGQGNRSVADGGDVVQVHASSGMLLKPIQALHTSIKLDMEPCSCLWNTCKQWFKFSSEEHDMFLIFLWYTHIIYIHTFTCTCMLSHTYTLAYICVRAGTYFSWNCMFGLNQVMFG